jgi:hypothetical protein
MKPPLPRTLSAVPQTLHTRLEIATAIRTLAGPPEDELLRQRRAEIAAIRRAGYRHANGRDHYRRD